MSIIYLHDDFFKVDGMFRKVIIKVVSCVLFIYVCIYVKINVLPRFIFFRGNILLLSRMLWRWTRAHPLCAERKVVTVQRPAKQVSLSLIPKFIWKYAHEEYFFTVSLINILRYKVNFVADRKFCIRKYYMFVSIVRSYV